MNTETVNLTKFAWLSIAAAVLTISMKAAAYILTGSVSLLSDAMESVVNLVAAIVALYALTLAAKPADSHYTFGRSKAEYFSAAIEGAMIFGAAALILFVSVQRLLSPVSLDNLGIGLVVSVLTTAINGLVGYYILESGKKHSSPTLVADGKHLLTDVITTVGVIFGVFLVKITGLEILDPIVAIIVGFNIIWIGTGLIRTSLAGLLDATLPEEENHTIVTILKSFQSETVSFHGLQTRQAGRLRFVRVDVQVPGVWTVREGHDFAHQIEAQIEEKLSDVSVTIHVEPIEDPTSYEDIPQGFVPLDGDDGFVPVDLETGKPITFQQ
ncbi:cation diffusion facilitator family transporter [Arcanobacterium bovis]|uniref:Cation transporter n=1 Tax=Arcanobacterium bovis TaxID=2529275 RepID=A0A4V2KR17_9ACTO|nr:cation diffusion facilitator family transporter [Arcanobacterium bovis]TBW20977.1 cation transporter [Arcanobacterium bovis]